jgi:hypothetical protein
LKELISPTSSSITSVILIANRSRLVKQGVDLTGVD